MRKSAKRVKLAKDILNKAGIYKESQQIATVMQGESIYKTVKRVLNIEPTKNYLQQVMQLNNIADPKVVMPGTKLKLPTLPAQPNVNMKPSIELGRFIMSHEGLSLYPYDDADVRRREISSISNARGSATIGWGHRLLNDPIKRITLQEAKRILLEDINVAADYIQKNTKIKLSQYQFDALTSVVFNVGRTGFAGSDIKKLIDQGRFVEAGRLISTFKVGTSAGLQKRRQAESVLFMGGTYSRGEGRVI